MARVPQISTVRSAGSDAVASSSVRQPARINVPFLVIVFLLVPQVTLRKRLNIDAIAKRQAARVPTLIARHWPRS